MLCKFDYESEHAIVGMWSMWAVRPNGCHVIYVLYHNTIWGMCYIMRLYETIGLCDIQCIRLYAWHVAIQNNAHIMRFSFYYYHNQDGKIAQCKGVATRSENSNEIVSVTSYLRKTIVAIAFVNDFVQGGRVELYRFVALYCCILIG